MSIEKLRDFSIVWMYLCPTNGNVRMNKDTVLKINRLLTIKAVQKDSGRFRLIRKRRETKSLKNKQIISPPKFHIAPDKK